MLATREVKVGLLVFLAVIFLAVIVFSVSDFYSFSPGYRLRVLFNSAGGIDVGAPVRLAGVTVGEVQQVRVSGGSEATTQAELVVWVKDFAKFEDDAVAYINTSGLIGEKYLEVTPGTRGARLLQDGEALRGQDSVAMTQFMNTGYEVVAQLNKTIAAIHAIVGDEETRAALKGAVTNSQEVTGELKTLLATANTFMEKLSRGEGTIGRLLTEDAIYRDLEATVKDIRAHPWKLFIRTKEKTPPASAAGGRR
ncbi:MAG: MCE family protein [Candidatus Omnitrophica bacterium]|nr:MCE family protein [Candidatus Omnitrophota bacterium]